MRYARRARAFTLIEVLVVVAIIALLISILLPSLKRARDMSRAVVCQTNERHLITAFITYSVDNKGRFPGNRQDENADWLGGDNGSPSKRIYGVMKNRGKQPEWGTIFKKHMGGMTAAYSCPDDKTYRERAAKGESFHSYTANLLTSGAKPEMLAGAHYPKPITPTGPGYDRTDHTSKMGAFEHVPVILEEHPDYWLNGAPDDSGWCNDDSFADRHLREAGNRAYSSIGYADGHVGKFQIPIIKPGMQPTQYLAAKYTCVRLVGGKWVSGQSWDLWTLVNPAGPAGGMYGFLGVAPDASSENLRHK
jgi:prepilin-type N-terminal cleavage/methylation domain-containing protein